MDGKRYVRIGIVLTAALLIVIVGWLLYSYFSYGDEWADYDELYRTEKGAAVFVEDTRTPYHALYREGRVYLPAELLIGQVDDRFYLSRENELFYTLPGGTVEIAPGQQSWTIEGVVTETPWPVCVKEGEVLYVVADLVERLVDVDVCFYDKPQRVLILPGSRAEERATVKKDAQVRVQAGRKSPILTEIQPEDSVCILGELDDWRKVRTDDGFVGYLPASALGETVTDDIVSGFRHPDYTGAGAKLDGPVRLVWHQPSTLEANRTFTEYIAPVEGVTVVSPTWFALSDNDGSITSLAEAWYVE
ncbi:MAG: SH3 domain-containing protein, partial [Lachnospiraceae bacterium]|nr:SH3 domain-containing protein [Lachnospiraceae bacterium]